MPPPPLPRRLRARNRLSRVMQVMMGLMGLITILALLATGGVPGFILAAVLALLPVPIYVLVVLAIDRFEPEPVRLLGWAFFWGATVATFLAGFVNEFGGAFLMGLPLTKMVALSIGAATTDPMAITAVFVAPVVEETLKGAALLILVLRKRDEFDGPVDGIVYGALVGLGFAMTENALYYTDAFVQGGAGGAAGLFVLRGIFNGFGHPLYTSMTGIGLGLALAGRAGPRRLILPIVGLVVGIGLHFLWNYSATVAESTGGVSIVVVYFGIMLPAVAIWLWFAARARRAEGRLIADHLAPDVVAGLLAPDIHAELGSLRGRTAAARMAMRQGGVAAMRARRAFHQAASDEGFRRWRASLGRETDATHRHEYLIYLAAGASHAPAAPRYTPPPSPAAPPTVAPPPMHHPPPPPPQTLG